MTTGEVLAELEIARRQFGPGQAESAMRVLARTSLQDFSQPGDLASLHEKLLFMRAYPASEEVALKTDDLLSGFGRRIAQLRRAGMDLEALEEPEISGIAGTGVTAVFSHLMATHLAHCFQGQVRIEWDACDSPGTLAHILPALIPFLDDDAMVEAHVPWLEWLRRASGKKDDLSWLLGAIRAKWVDGSEAARRYEALGLPLRLEIGECCAARSMMRLAPRELFFHTGALIRRQDVRLDEIPALGPLPVRSLSRVEGELMLRLARATSAVRYRELHGFTFGDPEHVYEIDAGRGVRFFLSGIAPEHRLPLRAYHAMTIWKNGVPIGYFEGLSFFERMEAGFNLYYTFRDGETAWLYQQVLRVLNQALGVTVFVLDPYQIGHENEEAIESGAFWFYRKLGFRSTSPDCRGLTAREERRISARPGYRTPASTLRKLVAAPMIYALPSADGEAWDRFETRRLGMKLLSHKKPLFPPDVVRAKRSAEEVRFLKALGRHPKLRAALIRLGS